MESKSHKSKSLETLKDEYVKQVGCTWEEAVREVPEYADVDRLNKYKVTKGRTLPEDFKVIDYARMFFPAQSSIYSKSTLHARYFVRKLKEREKRLLQHISCITKYSCGS